MSVGPRAPAFSESSVRISRKSRIASIYRRTSLFEAIQLTILVSEVAVEERQLVLLELLEPVIPFDTLE